MPPIFLFEFSPNPSYSQFKGETWNNVTVSKIDEESNPEDITDFEDIRPILDWHGASATKPGHPNGYPGYSLAKHSQQNLKYTTGGKPSRSTTRTIGYFLILLLDDPGLVQLALAIPNSTVRKAQ